MKRKKFILFDLDGTLLSMPRADFEREMFRRTKEMLHQKFPDTEPVLDALRYATFESQNFALPDESNEAVFERLLRERLGNLAEDVLQAQENFYAGEYNDIANLQEDKDRGKRLICAARSACLIPVLATNPVSPLSCIKRRIDWAGLTPETFAWITTADNCHHRKPEADYYLEIMKKTGAATEECLMVGNDTEDDIRGAAEAGIDTYLITDYLVDRNGIAEQCNPRGTAAEFIQFLKNMEDK